MHACYMMAGAGFEAARQLHAAPAAKRARTATASVSASAPKPNTPIRRRCKPRLKPRRRRSTMPT